MHEVRMSGTFCHFELLQILATYKLLLLTKLLCLTQPAALSLNMLD